MVHSALVVTDEDAPWTVALLAEGTGGVVRTEGFVGTGGIEVRDGLLQALVVLRQVKITLNELVHLQREGGKWVVHRRGQGERSQLPRPWLEGLLVFAACLLAS